MIKEIDYGIACRIGDTIYINKNLKKYPTLYKNIIKHELSHNKNFKQDFLLDFKGKYIEPKSEYYRFILTHPRSLYEFLPFGTYEKKTYINFNILILYLIALFSILIAIRLIYYLYYL